MLVKLDLFDKMPDISSSVDQKSYSQHIEIIKSLAKKTLPEEFFEQDFNEANNKRIQIFLNESLPIIKWSEIYDSPSNLSIIILCKHRSNVSNFFYDMISRWLIPEKKINIELFFSADFIFENLSKEKFTVIESVIRLETKEESQIVKKNIKSIETEIRLGVVSDFHADRIREFKGLSDDRKTAMVQEKIGSLIQTKPKDFGRNIFSEMQQFLIMSRDEFKSARDYHHISRIISILYLIRKIIKQNLDQDSTKRNVIIKFFKTRVRIPNQEAKSVLGILVGLNFLKEHELFEKRHLIKAVSKYIPNIKEIENSYFIDKINKNAIQTCYLEIEKENGKEISYEELKLLKDELPLYIKGNVEHLLHPVFMPRNEEEIVRNIMTLSHQLKYVHDFPQVIINFDKQSSNDLSYNIILSRVLKPNIISVRELLATKANFKYVLDRVKKVGVIRRKYLKEANVFRFLLPISKYLRDDHSVDLNRARRDIISNLNEIFGEVRDYNGGMILKQNEAYQSLKTLLGQVGKQNELLLEKLFYSITPAEMTTVIKSEIFKNLFLMLLNAIKREETRIKKHQDWLFKQELKVMHVIIPLQDQNLKKKITEDIENLHLVSSELISFSLFSNDINYLGYTYFTEDKIKQKSFFESIKQALDF